MPSQGQKHILSLLPLRQGSLPQIKGTSGNNFLRRICQRGSKIYSSSKTSLFEKTIDPKNVCENFQDRFCFLSKKMRFWRSYEFVIRVGRCVVKSYCPKCPYFWGDFLGEGDQGVNDSICVENLDLEPKMTSTIWCFDVMII